MCRIVRRGPLRNNKPKGVNFKRGIVYKRQREKQTDRMMRLSRILRVRDPEEEN